MENRGGIPLLVRWTTDFDCKSRTGWWYVIKDTPFNINELKAKRRYEINKGKKNFEVKRIRPSDYLEELFKVYSDAIINWPEKYRPSIEKISFKREILEWENDIVYGCLLYTSRCV